MAVNRTSALVVAAVLAWAGAQTQLEAQVGGSGYVMANGIVQPVNGLPKPVRDGA